METRDINNIKSKLYKINKENFNREIKLYKPFIGYGNKEDKEIKIKFYKRIFNFIKNIFN